MKNFNLLLVLAVLFSFNANADDGFSDVRILAENGICAISGVGTIVGVAHAKHGFDWLRFSKYNRGRSVKPLLIGGVLLAFAGPAAYEACPPTIVRAYNNLLKATSSGTSEEAKASGAVEPPSI